MKSIEAKLERFIFVSRWLMAPFYVGLVVGLFLLMLKFIQELLHLIPTVFSATDSGMTLAILTLVDLSLVGNLLIMIIFAGYENFVSKIDTSASEDRPDWMGKVDFGGLKLKLIASMVAISGIQLLKAFMNIESANKVDLGWLIGLHMTFVLSGVLLAVMDRLSNSSHTEKLA